MTTEAVLWEWLNGLSDASTRGVAAEGYHRAHADARIEVVPFQPELIDSAVQLYRTRPDKDWSLTDCLSFVVTARPICRDFGCSDTVDTMGICSLILRELHVSPLGKPGSERHFSSSTGDGKNYNSTFSHKPATACCQHCSAIGLLSL